MGKLASHKGCSAPAVALKHGWLKHWGPPEWTSAAPAATPAMPSAAVGPAAQLLLKLPQMSGVWHCGPISMHALPRRQILLGSALPGNNTLVFESGTLSPSCLPGNGHGKQAHDPHPWAAAVEA